jgi:hypothetical protein
MVAVPKRCRASILVDICTVNLPCPIPAFDLRAPAFDHRVTRIAGEVIRTGYAHTVVYFLRVEFASLSVLLDVCIGATGPCEILRIGRIVAGNRRLQRNKGENNNNGKQPE